jgi:hypothetical protein
LNGVPVLVVAMAGETAILDVAPGPTEIAPETPVSASVPVAVTVWLPAVFRVIDPVPIPPVIVALAGNTAWASELEKCTEPG